MAKKDKRVKTQPQEEIISSMPTPPVEEEALTEAKPVGKLTVVVKEPGVMPRITTIPDTLESLQKQVNGYIRPVMWTIEGTTFTMYVDEEADLKRDVKLNLTLPNGQKIFGPVVFTITNDAGKDVSIPEAEAKKVLRQFR